MKHSIIERLKKIRKHYGKSQREFSELIKVSDSTVAMWETGERKIKDIHILTICQVFHISEEWLRLGTGKMTIDVEDIQLWLANVTAGDKEFEKKFIELLENFSMEDWKILEKTYLFMQKKKD